MKGDLHVHSRYSDGSWTISEALTEAKRIGLGYISFVDHDTVAGTEEALALAPTLGIKAIPGIEISAYDAKRRRKAHILGYSYEPTAKALRAFCGPILAARDALTRTQVGILRDAGYPVCVAEVEAVAGPSTALYKQHIMAVLTAKGAADGIYGVTYKKLFKGGGPCDREIDYPNAFDAIRAIQADGGYAVLAHPGQLDSWELLEELANAGLDGVEIYHGDHGPIERRRVLATWRHHPHLILTGGSDSHGSLGSEQDIGEICAPAGADLSLARRESWLTLTES